MRTKVWRPVRVGNIYCSPACGASCTWEAYQAAMHDGEALRKRMIGRGWKLRVWENVGWHWSVDNFGASVYPAGGVFYKCLLNLSAEFQGTIKNFSDPNRAVHFQIKQATKALYKVATVILTLEAAIKSREG